MLHQNIFKLKCSKTIFLECWAGAVSITVIGTFAVFRALIPTSTFRNLISGFAGLRIGGKHISFAAAKLVRLLKLLNHKVHAQ